MKEVNLTQFKDNQQIQEQQKRQIKILMNKISFCDDPDANKPKKYVYNTDSITPFLDFYKLLALRPCDKDHKYKLKINIPDTIIFNDKDAPLMWIFTNQKGQVMRIDNVPYHMITSKLTEGALNKEVIGVLKKPQYGYGGISGNDVKVISCSEIKTVMSAVLGSRNEISVIQRFVKCHSVKASILRTCWRRNGNNQGWILSSNYQYNSASKVNQISKFIVNTKMPKAFNAIKCTSQKFLKETLGQVKSIAKFIQMYLKIQFGQLVCDFIRDQGGNWWYLNTRAFILNNQPKKINIKLITMHDDEPLQVVQKKKLQTYTKCKKCKYCNKMISQNIMSHKLTLMMILQCDQHLIRLGKSFLWLERSYNMHLDSVNLYIQHKICDSCYKFYKEVQRLVALEKKLAELLGIKILIDNKSSISITSVPYFKGHNIQFGTRLQKMKYDSQMPEGWQLPKEKQLKIQLANQNVTAQKYHLIIYIHGIRDIPLTFLQSQNKYSIQYELFGQKVKVAIKFDGFERSDDSLFKISIEKIKLFYLFAEKRQDIKAYIQNNSILQVYLYENDQPFGIAELELHQLKSQQVIKRDFFKMFSGKRIFPYLSWGLFISIGLYQCGKVSTSNIRLSKKQGLLIPDVEYHNADPLAEDWINMIKEKPDRHISTTNTVQSQQSKGFKLIKANTSYLTEQIQSYSRRKVPSTHQAKRKPYYS